MTEQKKARAVVLPCGKLCDDSPDYCGDCIFWEYNEDKSESYGRPTGDCPKRGGVRWSSESGCSDGRRK